MASSKAIAISVLVLRVITLSSLAACVAVIATNNYKLSGGEKANFTDVNAYRYVLATALIGLAYTLLQIPLSIYHVRTDKRLFHGDFLITTDFYADKVISFLLATGVGAGFAVGIESKNFVKELFVFATLLGVTDLEEWRSKTLNFFDRGNIATGLLLLGFISMALISVLTSINLTSRSSGRKSFF